MLILASASPRRHELLLAAGIEHVVRAASVDETQYPGEPARIYVQRLAREKARAVDAADEDIVLAADTTVCVDGEILGKPADGGDAKRMLQLLSGRDHFVYTGICLRGQRREIVDVAATRVTFLELSARAIDEYVASGEAMDKAGAYGIQGLASRFVARIDGSYQNVVGLPVSLVWRYLNEFATS